MKPIDEHDPRWDFDLSGERGLGEEEYKPESGLWAYVLLAIALGLVMALVAI